MHTVSTTRMPSSRETIAAGTSPPRVTQTMASQAPCPDSRVVETVCIASYHAYKEQGEPAVLKGVSPELREDGGARALIVDDLVDTGRTARIVRELLPRAHFATVYAKPLGRALVDTFVTEVSQDTWIYFPWDMGLQFQPPLRDGAAA